LKKKLFRRSSKAVQTGRGAGSVRPGQICWRLTGEVVQGRDASKKKNGARKGQWRVGDAIAG